MSARTLPGLDRPEPILHLDDNAPQWKHDLDKHGYAIVKGVLSEAQAAHYVEQAEAWLEGFNFGYKRDDPSTWQKKHLPKHNKGGLYQMYSFAHSQWVWDIKCEPAIVDLFKTLWDTDKLTVSFDSGNLSVPLPLDQIEDGGKPWPHADQNPRRKGLHSVQGIINLLPNGPEDGGLTVLRGSSVLWKQFQQEHPENAARWGEDWMDMTDADQQWFYDRGCEWVKPCLEAGDFIFWDSRTVHYGAVPRGRNKRFCVYVCMKPAEELEPAQQELKIKAFKEGLSTSHDPINFRVKPIEPKDNIQFPYGRPILNQVGRQLVGLEAW